MTITLSIYLPPRCLNPNGRTHWSKKSRQSKLHREASAWTAKAWFMRNDIPEPQWAAATVQCVFYFATARTRDEDNLLASMKAAFDGLADAGIVLNDAGLTHLPVIQRIDKRDQRVEMIITERKL